MSNENINFFKFKINNINFDFSSLKSMFVCFVTLFRLDETKDNIFVKLNILKSVQLNNDSVLNHLKEKPLFIIN